jgi:hypothetical protein
LFPLPIYVWVIVLVGLTGITATICANLWRGALRAGLTRATAAQITAAVGFGWAAWVVASCLLADADIYRLESAINKPWIGVGVLVPLAVALLFARIPAVSRILARPDALYGLTVPQTFRLVGVAFVVVMALGKLPAVFALPAGLGDIAVGLEAAFLARRIRRGIVGPGALWLNILGLVDLIVALGIGFAAGPGPARVLFVTPSTEAISLLPLVLIPTTVVPLAAALHVLSLAKLRAAHRAAVATPAPSTK